LKTSIEAGDEDLDKELITFLASHRYSELPDQQRISSLEAQLRDWTEVGGHLNSFSSFMKTYGPRLVGNDDLPDDAEQWVPAKPQLVEEFTLESDNDTVALSKRTAFSGTSHRFIR